MGVLGAGGPPLYQPLVGLLTSFIPALSNEVSTQTLDVASKSSRIRFGRISGDLSAKI